MLRKDRPGFDVLIGNPPWEEATVEELKFWTIRFPGLSGLPTESARQVQVQAYRDEHPQLVEEYLTELDVAEFSRRALVGGPYPGMGTGDPDTYKAFTWRFWDLLRAGGSIGMVLPRSALSAAGSAPWRNAVVQEGSFTDVTMTLNTAGWVFDDAEHRYTIGLVTIRKGAEFAGQVSLRGPYSSLSRFEQRSAPVVFPVETLLGWSENASFPMLPSERCVEVFKKLRLHPRLDSQAGDWRVRAATEFHATNDKPLFELKPATTDGLWPVYKGASFKLWEPDTGEYYAWADPEVVIPHLQSKRLRSARREGSPFVGFGADWLRDPETLPCMSPRIAFRDIARATDTRTMIAALVPGDLVMTNKAPYLLWPKGSEVDQAYLLGVLCSMPCDWYFRRIVEISMNFHLLNTCPIPRPPSTDRLYGVVANVAGALAAVDDRYSSWAAGAGVSVGSLAGQARLDSINRIDAAVAHLYGLGEADLATIYSTFHENDTHAARLSAVLDHFRDLR